MKLHFPRSVNPYPNRAAKRNVSGRTVLGPIRGEDDVVADDFEVEVGERDVDVAEVHRVRVLFFVEEASGAADLKEIFRQQLS